MIDFTRQAGCPSSMNDGGAVREVLDRIGDKWSLLVIGALSGGPLRFGALEKAVAGISQRMLTLTLKHLVQDGLVSRTAYAEVPPRVEYAVTELGKTLVPLVLALADWALEHSDEINAARRSRGRHAESRRRAGGSGGVAHHQLGRQDQ